MPEAPTKFNLHKVLATISLILIPTLITGAGIWYWVEGKNTTVLLDDEPTKTASESANTASTSAQINATESWKTLTNTTVGYTVKYPENWLLNGTVENTGCDDETVFLAPTNDLLGKCASGYGGLVGIFRTQPGLGFTDHVAQYKVENYDDFTKTETTLSAKTAVKIIGISKVYDEMVDNRGQKEIHYIIDLGTRTVALSYNQPKSTQDYSEIFEQIVQTFKFL